MSRTKVPGVLARAVVPVVAAALTATASFPARADEPTLTLASLRDVKAAGSSTSSSASGAVIALPLESPSVNGFQPFVVFGLTDEHSSGIDAIVEGSNLPGGSVVPNPARYFIGTLDSGSSAHIIGDDDSALINLAAHGVDGPNTVQLSGAGGSETLDAFVSDALGFYVTGLGNATPSASGPVVSPSVLKGMTNAPILTIEEESIIPNIVGAPTFAHHQIAIFNSQTKRLTVNGQTYQGPHVELRSFSTPVGGQYARVSLELAGPPDPFSGGPTSPTQEATFFPDFVTQSDWTQDPWGPAQWNSMYAEVDLARGGQSVIDEELLFDTGAQVSLISTDVANDLGISTNPGSETPADFTVEVLGIGGITVLPGYFIDSLGMRTDLGTDTVWTNVPIIVGNLPNPRGGGGFVPGIIGMNLFNDRDLIIQGNLNDPFFAFSKVPITPMWTGTAGGIWGDNSKWTLGVPDVPEKLANFTSSTPAPQTITVEADYTLGRLRFDNAAGTYTINGPGRLTFEMVAGPSLIEVAAGSHTVHAPITLRNDATFKVTPAGSTLTITNDVSAADHDMFKSGDGTLAMKNVRAKSLSVNAGKVTMLPNGGPTGTSTVGALSVAVGARLDLKDNDLIIDYTGASPVAAYEALIASAYNVTGDWQGDGITSSIAALDGGYVVAIADNATLPAPFGTAQGGPLFSGIDVDLDTILIKFTHRADVNLDGVVTPDDSAIFGGNYDETQPATWATGDMNYDGMFTPDDAAIFGGAYDESLMSLPEPSAVGLLLLMTAGMVTARRRVG